MGVDLVGDRARRAYDAVAWTRRAETVEELDAVMGAAFREMGFDTYLGLKAFGADGRPNPELLFGQSLPGEWIDRYQKQGYVADDAAVRSIMHSDEPMYWSDLKRGPISPRSLRILDEAAEFGLKEGYFTPLPRSDGAIAGMVLIGQNIDTRDDDLRTTAFLLSTHYAALCRKLMYRKPPGPMLKPLTARQIECLMWVRDGKSSHDIGDILKISEHTVTEYINEACARLGVRSRTQAVIEAGLRQLIQL